MKIVAACVVTLCMAGGAPGQSRLFMAVDGAELSAPGAGPTTVVAAPGSTVRIMVWFDAADTEIVGYQCLLPREATPLPDAGGAVSYVDGPGFYTCLTPTIGVFGQLCVPGDPLACDGNPDDCAFSSTGDSIFVDETRADYLFADVPSIGPVYSESQNLTPPSFGMFVTTVDAGTGVIVSDIRYLGQFDVATSADAVGTFELAFRTPPLSPPLSAVFLPFGTPVLPLELQPVHIVMARCGDGVTTGAEQCDDGNTTGGDGCSDQCTFEVEVPAMTWPGMILLAAVLLGAVARTVRRRPSP